MPLDRALLDMGWMPQGVTPKTRIGNSEPGYYDTSSLANVARALEVTKFQQEQEDQKRMQQLKEEASMYRTLRMSGYDSTKATDIVKSRKFEGGGGKTQAEQEYGKKVEQYDARIKEINAKTELTKQKMLQPPDRVKELTGRILTKVGNNEPLTVGEQKVYDDYIKKYGQKSDLESILSGGDKSTPTNTFTPDQENLIQAWMKKYPGKSREEIIQKAKEKGLL